MGTAIKQKKSRVVAELSDFETKKKKKSLPAKKSTDLSVQFKLPDTIKSHTVTREKLTSFARRNLFEYGQYVVQDRAVPEFRDGLKPVHRHILYAMAQLNLFGNDFKKCARVVGDTIGKYHPHGDVSTYGALVTLANTVPNLIKGRGNFGSPTDGPAAQRYCFVGGTRIMTEHGLVRIDDLPKFEGQDPEDYLHTDKYKVDLDLKVSSLVDPKPASHWINSGFQKTFGIKTELGNSTRCTPNQPFYVLEGLDYSWKNAEDLKLGDKVCIKLEAGLDTSSGKSLPEFNYVPFRKDTHTYDQFEFPQTMSEDLAFVLGALVAEGSCRGKGFGIEFSNTNKAYYNKFVECWKRIFGSEIEYTESIKQPHGYGKLRTKVFYAKYDVIGNWFTNLGIKWGSYNQRVPECIFQAAKTEVRAFLSGLFEGDSCIAGTQPDLHTMSDKLRSDVQLLLLNRLGIYSKILKTPVLRISGARNILNFFKEVSFVSKKKKATALKKIVELNAGLEGSYNAGGSLTSDDIPTEFIKAFAQELTKFKISLKKFKAEDGSVHTVLPNTDTSGCMQLFSKIPASRKKLIRHFELYAESARKFWPELVSKLEFVIYNSYIYSEVVEIKSLGKKWVYDLTVPETHAFVANGFVSHNTECKLSDYSKLFLLDKGYMEVVPKIDNYDNSEKIPLYLPSLLPTMLLIGNSGGIAYGVRACNPAFEIEGVTKLIDIVLSKGSVTDADCVKHLVIQAPYGSTCVATKEELADFITTGRAKSIKYCPQVQADYKNKIVEIVSYSPGFQSEEMVSKKRDKIRELPEVSRWVSDCGEKRPNAGPYGAYYYVIPKRGISDDGLSALVTKIKKILTGSEFYNLGLTINNINGNAKFLYCNFSTYIKNWVRYRVELECRYLENIIEKRERDLWEYNVQMYACINKDQILEVMKKALDKDDPDTYAAKALKIPIEQATYIIELKMRRLAKLEINSIKEKIKAATVDIKGWKKDLSNPNPRISASLNESVNKYKKIVQTAIDDSKKIAKRKKKAE